MTAAAMAACTTQAMTTALPAMRRASSRRPAPMARDTSTVAAIISPMPEETEKNWIAKAKPIAATSRGSPSKDTQKRFVASTRKTKVMPAAPVMVMRTTWPMVDPARNRPSTLMRGYSAGAGAKREKIVSFPGSGWRGIISASVSDVAAMAEASRNTDPGDTSHR